MAKTNSKIKDIMVTFRANEEQERYIEAAQEVLEDNAVGRRVTKTETILTLLTYGMKEFNQKYGNPLKKRTRKKA